LCALFFFAYMGVEGTFCLSADKELY
jgi:hypothetical protein